MNLTQNQINQNHKDALMKKFFYLLLALFVAAPLVMADDIWTEKAQNPSWWPFRYYDASRPTVRTDKQNNYHDMAVPCPTNRTTVAFTANNWDAAQEIVTNVQLVATDDPFREVTGYWPNSQAAAAYLNGKYMVCCGMACNNGYSGLFFTENMANYVKYKETGEHVGGLLDLGYSWPTNLHTEAFSYNRSVQFSIYDVESDTWDSSKWDGSGPPTFVNMEDGKCNYRIANNEWGVQEAVAGDGVRCGSNQAFLYDFDESGTPSFFLHAGYPNWSGNFQVYNPSKGDGDYGQWSGSAKANAFPSGGYYAQYDGGAVCIDGVAYVLGGGFWGQNGTSLQTYNTKTDQWRSYEKIYPDSLTVFGIAAMGSKVYLVGDQNASTKIRVLETATNVFELVDSDMNLQIGVREAAVVGYNGVIYVIGGRTYDADNKLVNLDTFQIVNTVLKSAVVHTTKLPVAAYRASCAVTEDGKLLFGGAMMLQDPKTGKNVCSSRLWIGEMPTQSLYITPTSFNYGQEGNSFDINLVNVSDDPIEVKLECPAEWLSIDQTITVAAQSQSSFTAVLDRDKLAGPVTNVVTVTWEGENVFEIPVIADIPRPVPVFDTKRALTLKPTTKSFKVKNNGTVDLVFTATSDLEGVTVKPESGTILPGLTTTFKCTVAEDCPRPSQALITLAYNSYDGSSEVFTLDNIEADYYVKPTGDDSNPGTSPDKAWKTLAYAFAKVPNGDPEDGQITLHVAPAVYAGDSTDETLWLVDLSKKSYVHVKGDVLENHINIGPGYFTETIDRPLVTPGDKIWDLGNGSDVWNNKPYIKLENVDHVRISNFIFDGSQPSTNLVTVSGGAGRPNITALIGINNANGVEIDNNYFYGMFSGELFNTTSNAPCDWADFYYCGLTYNGVIGLDDLKINNNVFEGFSKAIYHNGYPARDELGNTNYVYISNNTFVKQHGDNTYICAISSNFADTWHTAAQICESNIFAYIPDPDYEPDPLWACAYVTGPAQITIGHDDYAVLSQYNQYYSIGGPGGDNYYADGVTYELDDLFYQVDFTDYTNEVPNFIEGTWFCANPDTEYGERYVGWSYLPEPAIGLALAALALALLRRK